MDNFYDHDFPNIDHAAFWRMGEPFFSEGLASPLGLGFLRGLDLDNISTGFDSLLPWRASTYL